MRSVATHLIAVFVFAFLVCAPSAFAATGVLAQASPVKENTGGTVPKENTGGTQGTDSSATGGTLLVNPLKNIDSLPDLLKVVLNAIVELGTIVLILAFVWVGFSFVKAQGKPEELTKARSAFVWTIIGGAILLGAASIAAVIESTVQGL